MKQEFITHNFSNIPIFIASGEQSDQESFSDWHFHEEMEFLWVRAHKKHIWINNQAYELFPNDIIFVNQYVPHKTYSPIGCSTFLLQCKPISNHTELLPYTQGKNFFIFRAESKENQGLLSCFSRLQEEYVHQAKSQRAFIQAITMEIFAYLYRYEILPDPEDQSISKERKTILPVLDYAQTHYAETISLAKASDILHMDKSYFCRLFKKAVGVSFLEYVYFLRLTKAEELLLSTDKTVTEIAYETGFPSSAYFTKAFKKRKGYTPTFYKKLQKR